MAEQIALEGALQAQLAELEELRKEIYALRSKGWYFIGGGILSIIAGTFLGNMVAAIAGAGLILIITGCVFLNKATPKFKAYRDSFKQKIVTAVLRSIDPDMQLSYESGLSESEFTNSQLFTTSPDRFHSEDQIHGSSGNTKFYFSEVHAEYKTETRTKYGTQTHWHTILKGIVFCADFNKHFKGLTVVRPKNFGSSIGAWMSEKLTFFSSGKQEHVKLEDPNFNEHFITHSSDQVEARYILTPAMMERLCELNSRSNDTISVSFIDSLVYIAFPLTTNYFEPPETTSLHNMKWLGNDLNIIRFMLGIIGELDLNTRIWGKQ